MPDVCGQFLCVRSHVVRDNQPSLNDLGYDIVQVRDVISLLGIDENEVERAGQFSRELASIALVNRDDMRQSGALEVGRRFSGPLGQKFQRINLPAGLLSCLAKP